MTASCGICSYQVCDSSRRALIIRQKNSETMNASEWALHFIGIVMKVPGCSIVQDFGGKLSNMARMVATWRVWVALNGYRDRRVLLIDSTCVILGKLSIMEGINWPMGVIASVGLAPVRVVIR